MKLFVDSADPRDIAAAVSTGLVDGVTTNPSLVARTGKPTREVVREICGLCDGPVSVEVVATDAPAMVREGRDLAALHPNVVVKLPLDEDGLEAVQALSRDGIRTNATLCFSTAQALVAAKAGATFVSPFIGRVDDHGWDGARLAGHIVALYERQGYGAQVLVASIRHPLHLAQVAQAGVHAATMPLEMIRQLAQHPLSSAEADGR